MRFLPGCSTKEAICILCADTICAALLLICVAWRGNTTYSKPAAPRASACTASPEQLTACAAAWMQLAQPGKSSNSHWTYWQAAEFQGFVDGISRRLIIGLDWCPGLAGPEGEVNSVAAVADYLIAHRGQEPPARDTATTVIIVLASKAPCVHPQSRSSEPQSNSP